MQRINLASATDLVAAFNAQENNGAEAYMYLEAWERDRDFVQHYGQDPLAGSDDVLAVMSAMHAEGWTPIGAGSFSLAFTHKDEPGKVFKINLHRTDNGPEYWPWCLENQGQPYVPKVYACGEIDGCRWVWMKEYIHSGMDDEGSYYAMLEAHGYGRYNLETFARRVRDDVADTIGATVLTDIKPDNMGIDADTGELVCLDPIW